MNLRPMLAASFPRHWSEDMIWDCIQRNLPLLVQPKLDGIRCIIGEGHMPLTRQGNVIPNKWIRQQLLSLQLPVGFDGEILTYASDGKLRNFNFISSNVKSEFGTPIFQYHVFDSVVRSLINWPDNSGFIKHVPSLLCKDIAAIKLALKYYLSQGHEGIMLRKPNTPYKAGRSTLNEFKLVKLKPFERDTGTIVDCIEMMHNISDNIPMVEGCGKSSKAENLRPAGMLGAFVVHCKSFTKLFNVGTGFTDAERRLYWTQANTFKGRMITFKYQANRTNKDKPISPVFEGFVKV